jgi:hypothetical protein
MKKHLEEAAVVAKDLTTRDLSVPGHTGLIGKLSARSGILDGATIEISGMA